MRKSFLTKEYSLEKVQGTLNMKELRNFFSSKILEIEDEMLVDENNIIWQENENKTQGIGLDTVNRVFNTFDVKNANHSIRIEPTQSDQQRREFTRWELTFNIREIIEQYLFAQLKKNRTFAGISNDLTFDNSVDTAILQYIRDNVYPRIEFARIELFIQYYKLGEPIPELFDSQNNPIIALQYDPQFRQDIINPTPLSGETTPQYNSRIAQLKQDILVKNYQLSTDPRENVATMIYKQTEISLDYKFDYYFNVVWRKA
jgi:hypothetical protein